MCILPQRQSGDELSSFELKDWCFCRDSCHWLYSFALGKMSLSFSVLKKKKIHLCVDIWPSKTDRDKDTKPNFSFESFSAEQSSDIKKKEKREREKKRQKRKINTTNFLFNAPSAPNFSLFFPSKTRRQDEHFPRWPFSQGCEGPRETGSSRAQEVGHGTETGRQGLSWPRPGCQTGGLPSSSRHRRGYAEALDVLPFIEQGRLNDPASVVCCTEKTDDQRNVEWGLKFALSVRKSLASYFKTRI